MAAAILSRAPSSATDSLFRLWGAAITSQMLAGGWVKSSDTGQIDWTTVLAPTASSQTRGYEMWKSNDPLKGTEFYVKFTFGSGSGATLPMATVQVGWATDGAGAFTGAGISTATTFLTVNAASLTVQPCHVAAGSGWLCNTIFTSASLNVAALVSIERARNDSGVETNNVLIVTSFGGNTTSQIVSPTVAYNQVSGPVAQILINTGASVQGLDVGYSLQCGQAGGLTNPSLNVFGASASIFAQVGLTVPIETYGETHYYIINNTYPTFYNSGSQMCLTRFE